MRYPFGGGISDFTLTAGYNNQLALTGGVTVTFWSAASGGSQYTNLSLDWAGTQIVSTITSSTGADGFAAAQLPQFYGPDGVAQMWASAGAGPRTLLTSPLVTLAAGVWSPADVGLHAWSFDPALATNATALTSGVLHLARLKLSAPALVSNIVAYLTIAGSGLTAGQCFAALLSSTGARLGVTADQASSWASAATPTKTMALTTPYSAAAGWYYAVLLANGTTGPSFARAAASTSQAGNMGLAAATYRFGQYGSALTAVPASVTVASITNGTGYCLALN